MVYQPENGTGLGFTGQYIPNTSTNYIKTATSLKNANDLLDAAILNRGTAGTNIYVKNTSTQSLSGSNTWTKVTFPTEVVDNNSEYNISTSTFTSLTAQTVLISSIIYINGTFGSNANLTIGIYLNGALFTKTVSACNNNKCCAHICYPMTLNANNTINIYATHDDGASSRTLDGSQVLSIKQLF